MTPESVREFWLGHLDPANVEPTKAQMGLWFGKDEAVDAHIQTHFAPHISGAIAGELDGWLDSDQGAVAWLILIDQFSRNAFRGTPGMYAGDARTLQVARMVIERGYRHLHPLERVFVYLPLEHAEDLEAQRQCVALYEELAADVPAAAREAYQGFVSYAVQHFDIVARFGRFPHRNAILGRENTPEETEFLSQPNSGF